MKSIAIAVELTDPELAEVRALLEQRSGVVFEDKLADDFVGRVRQHMEANRFFNGVELLRALRNSNSEYEKLLARLLGYEPAFFRYPEMYRALADEVLPEIRSRKFWDNPRTLRIWNAGCGSGDESYSVALAIMDSLDTREPWAVSILATDINRQALLHADRGVYPHSALQALTPRQLETYFARVGDQFLVKPSIRKMVSFAAANVTQDQSMEPVDVIFCLDVLRYLPQGERATAVQRLYSHLKLGGYLFLGPADSGAHLPAGFESLDGNGRKLYRRPESNVSDRLA